jgi:hypothetical protein
MPGGGQGRKDKIEKTGVYPVSAMEDASPDAMVHGEAPHGNRAREVPLVTKIPAAPS